MKEYTNIGGQAVIEGVMMRSPNTFVIAVRRSDGIIKLRRAQWFGLSKKINFLKKPFIRGILVLFETMANGIVSLNYSARVAMDGELIDEAKKHGVSEQDFADKLKRKEKVGLATYISIVVSVIFGIALFKVLPHVVTVFFSKYSGMAWGLDNYRFHLVDGVLKGFIFLLYVFIIGFVPDIKRVFQYHGAEHKSISTFEAGEELIVENARKYTTFHPRCGTTFIFFLLFISIIIFALVFSVIPIKLGSSVILKHIVAIGIKICLMFPIAGLSYELIKFVGKRFDSPFGKIIAYPGMLLQRLTTKAPDDQQLEVALASIKAVLFLEDHYKLSSVSEKIIEPDEIEIKSIDEVQESNLQFKDFLER